MSYTNGPWELGEGYEAFIVYGYDGFEIASCAGPSEKAMPNARLIALAPTMLDMIEACVRELQKHETPKNYCSSVQLDALHLLAAAQGKD